MCGTLLEHAAFLAGLLLTTSCTEAQLAQAAHAVTTSPGPVAWAVAGTIRQPGQGAPRQPRQGTTRRRAVAVPVSPPEPLPGL